MSPVRENHQLPEPLPTSPMHLFRAWFDEAHAKKIQPNPNAMSLATVGPEGKPSVRIVLCKGIDPESASLVFHTNYHGRKGRDLESNPHAAACFHWDPLDRQARFEGLVTRATPAESDAYFTTRPWISKVGAWASDQSQPVATRHELILKVESAMRRFGIDPANPPPPDAKIQIERPPHWGGYRLWVQHAELWGGIVGRLHDRARWSRELPPLATLRTAPPDRTLVPSAWCSTRLQP